VSTTGPVNPPFRKAEGQAKWASDRAQVPLGPVLSTAIPCERRSLSDATRFGGITSYAHHETSRTGAATFGVLKIKRVPAGQGDAGPLMITKATSVDRYRSIGGSRRSP
jgi:hypothetical protein